MKGGSRLVRSKASARVCSCLVPAGASSPSRQCRWRLGNPGTDRGGPARPLPTSPGADKGKAAPSPDGHQTGPTGSLRRHHSSPQGLGQPRPTAAAIPGDPETAAQRPRHPGRSQIWVPGRRRSLQTGARSKPNTERKESLTLGQSFPGAIVSIPARSEGRNPAVLGGAVASPST